MLISDYAKEAKQVTEKIRSVAVWWIWTPGGLFHSVRVIHERTTHHHPTDHQESTPGQHRDVFSHKSNVFKMCKNRGKRTVKVVVSITLPLFYCFFDRLELEAPYRRGFTFSRSRRRTYETADGFLVGFGGTIVVRRPTFRAPPRLFPSKRYPVFRSRLVLDYHVLFYTRFYMYKR